MNSMDLYIYYRVATENAETLARKVRAMQQSLSNEYGIVSALKRRPEERDRRQTWMEVYLAVPAEFGATLERAVTREGLPGLIDGQRNTEIFVDVSLCV